MCGVLLPAAIALLLAFLAVWYWIVTPIRSFSPEERERDEFNLRLSAYGRYAVGLGVLLVVVATTGAVFACD